MAMDDKAAVSGHAGAQPCKSTTRVALQKQVDPATGIRPISQWGPECAKGMWKADSRYAPVDDAVPNPNRKKLKKLKAAAIRGQLLEELDEA